MAAQTVKLLGKAFVLIPKREFDRMCCRLAQLERQDCGDVAEARRRAMEPSVPLRKVRKHLGI